MLSTSTNSVIIALDDATKLSALKRWALDNFEENETINSVKALADDTGMIVLIGVPLIVSLALASFIMIYCCKNNVKCQTMGQKLKDKIVFGMLIQIGIVSFLSFAYKSGFGRVFDHTQDRPTSSPVFLVIVILLLSAAFFFPTFVDRGL